MGRTDKLKAALETLDTCSLSQAEHGELTLEIPRDQWIEMSTRLRDEARFGFDTPIDLCVVDYLSYGQAEWSTEQATGTGFSRGVERGPVIADYESEFDARRFAVVVHLLSTSNNTRVRIKTFTGTSNPPIVASLVDVWPGVNWFEREAFDLFGVLFEGHPDLRRLLTDYGFIGHPFRKDFPLTGNVEVRYDPEQGRVAYQPVSIEERTLVPRVIRDDNRYEQSIREDATDG